jgi:hypothetical protein
MKIRIIYALCCLLTAPAFAQSHHTDTAKNHPDYITKAVKIDGLVGKELTLTVADLKKMKVEEVKNYDVIGKGGVVKSHLNSFTGVLLKNVLSQAQAGARVLKESGQLYIVASASDNFKVVFSWAELFNTPVGDHVYIAFAENGKPILNEGELVLFTTIDKINGMRHIKWLKEIAVKKAEI